MEGIKKRGFALLDKEQRIALARMGGLAVHAKGKAHRFTREQAKNAGILGGQVVSANREHMSQIGKIGGTNSRRKVDETGTV